MPFEFPLQIEVGGCANRDDYATDIQPITYEGPYENNVHRLPNERALYCIQLSLARNDERFFNVFAGFFHYPMRRSTSCRRVLENGSRIHRTRRT